MQLAHASPVGPSWVPLYSIPLLFSAAVYSRRPGFILLVIAAVNHLHMNALSSPGISHFRDCVQSQSGVQPCLLGCGSVQLPEVSPPVIQGYFYQLKLLLTSIAN